MKTVVFDLDGTLADTSGDLIAAANACFRAMGAGDVLHAGDVILQVNRRGVSSPEEMETILRRSSGSVTVLFVSGQQQRFAVLSRR